MPDQTAIHYLYIYYKLPEIDQHRTLPAVQQILAAGRPWCAKTSLVASQARDGQTTWMEVYEGVSNSSSLESALEQAVKDSGLAVSIAATRKIEWFQSLPHVQAQ